MWGVHVCLCVCVYDTGQVQRRRDQHRMSAESYHKLTTHHRYDSDSSLDLAVHTRYDSVVPPRKMFRRSLPRLSAVSPHSTVHHSAGSKSHENIQILTRGHSRSGEGYLRSSDTQDGGDRINEGELVSGRGHTGSQDMQAGKEAVPKDQLVSSEGRSRSNEMLCENCGCERSGIMTSTAVDHHRVASDHMDAIGAARGQSPDRAATDGQDNKQGSTAVAVSKCGSENAAPRGMVGTVESRRGGGGGMLAVESYSGDVSRQLCEQLVGLLSDLNTARDLNVDVRITSSLTHNHD